MIARLLGLVVTLVEAVVNAAPQRSSRKSRTSGEFEPIKIVPPSKKTPMDPHEPKVKR